MPIQIRDEDRRDDAPICSPYEPADEATVLCDSFLNDYHKMKDEEADTVPAGFEPTDHAGVLIEAREVTA